MNWDDARLFLAVCRHGQFLAASQQLGINQSTLGRRVANLETSVGSKLLIRRTNGCELTAAGQKLFHSIQNAEGEILSGLEGVAEQDAQISGTVRIGAPDGFGIGFLASKLGAFDRSHPKVKIELVPVPRSFSLSQREADIAIMVGRPDKGKLVAKKLVDYSLGLYASKDYLDRNGRPAHIRDLSKHRLIGFVEDLIYTPLLNYTQEITRHWHSNLAISSAAGQLEAANGGAGIAILHDYLARDVSELEPVLPAKKINRSYWLAIHESQRDLARISAVTAFLSELVKQQKSIF